MLAWINSLLIGLLLIVSVGCEAPHCLQCCCSCWRPNPALPLECRDATPQPLLPDLSSLPSNPVPLRTVGPFCAISEKEAQCLAASNSKAANLLAKEADVVGTQRERFGHDSGLCRELLLLRSTHQRNQDAAVALELFLRLVEAEAGSQTLDQRMRVLTAMQADADHLQAHGLTSPLSKSELAIQRLELLHRQAEVQGTIYRLNHQLAESLGVELNTGTRYWPEADLLVNPNVPNSNAVVALAMENRADLAAVRMASQAEGRQAIAAAELILQPLGIGSATSSSPHMLIKLSHLFSHRREAAAREDQLFTARHQQELGVESEVRQAADLVTTRLSQIAITHDRQRTIDSRLEANQRQQNLIASPLSMRMIKVDVLTAQQDLLHDVVEWKIAVVKLKQAQGLLATECGWNTGCVGH